MEKFITSRGVEVEFRSLSKELMLRFNSTNPQPQPPTYDVTSAVTGTTEHIAIDERSIREKPEQFTAEQHAAWNEYAGKQSEFLLRFVKFFCLRGLDIRAKMDDWLEERKYLEIPVSENKAERRFEWIIDEALATGDDYKTVIIGVMEASGVPTDLLEQVEELFRGDVQQDSTEPTGDTGGQVAGEPELHRSESDVPPSPHVERVGKTKRAKSRVGIANSGDA